MSDTETRSLGRVALLLLLASVVRLGLTYRHVDAPPPAPDVLPGLLAESRERAAEEEARSRPLEPGERLDPNHATAVELDRLPGVGPAIAEALVSSRDAEGPFRGAEDLLRVRGVGPALLERIRPHLELAPVGLSTPRPPRPGRLALPAAAGRAPSSPVRPRPAPRLDLNRADTLALQALPGVGPALARRIVAAREEARFRTLEDLLKVRGIGPATLARLRPLVAVSP
ncbi:MAG TPA: helix-hairpin-helix domain-containing protein [Longimicrobiales bacterium]|nr:helix-hairpin-helix domain-containing protein [Longimicrobiales bacterium]